MPSFLMNKQLATLFVSQMTRGTAVRAKSSETLTRSGIAKIISEQYPELNKVNSEKIVKTVFDSIVEVLYDMCRQTNGWQCCINQFISLALFIQLQKVADKGVVRISDFGTFYSFHAQPRNYRNPKTKAIIEKPAVDRPKFKAYDSFKDSVNKETESTDHA